MLRSDREIRHRYFDLLAVLLVCGGVGGCAGGRPEAAESPASEPEPAMTAAEERTCPPGRHLSAGRCCLEGAEWVPARDQCVCLEPAGCPEPVLAAAEETPPAEPEETGPEEAEPEPCPEGRVRSSVTRGHCCWPAQEWSVTEERCSGAPVCPQGQLIHGDDCAPGEVQRWIEVPPGSFTMGSPEDELHRFSDERQHRVTLTRGFMILATEVRQAEFEEVMGYNPSRFDECGGNCPVEQVSWHQAAVYCNALSAAEGLAACYACEGEGRAARCEPRPDLYDCPGYRLPTEAEWEYAARAGAEGPRYGEVINRIAWYRGNSQGTTWRVGTREPNAWGIYDMLGNVMEWCNDWFGDYPTGDVTDPLGPSSGDIRVVRGGSWIINSWRVRSAYRYRFAPEARVAYLGFRPVRTLRPQANEE